MIQVTVGTNTDRNRVMVNPGTTVRTVLEDNHIDYAAGAIRLDSEPISGAELDKTFEDFGITEKCYLLSIVKANGGR